MSDKSLSSRLLLSQDAIASTDVDTSESNSGADDGRFARRECTHASSACQRIQEERAEASPFPSRVCSPAAPYTDRNQPGGDCFREQCLVVIPTRTVDPAVGALQSAFVQQQHDLNQIFCNMIASMQDAREVHHKQLGSILAQATRTHEVPPQAPTRNNEKSQTFATDISFQSIDKTVPRSQRSESFDVQGTPQSSPSNQESIRVSKRLSFKNTQEQANIKLQSNSKSRSSLRLGVEHSTGLTIVNRIVNSIFFRVLVIVMILANFVQLGWQSDSMLDAAKGDSNSRQSNFHVGVHTALDWLFCFFFTAEIALRIFAVGPSEFVCGQSWKWNGFDSALVLLALADSALTMHGVGRLVRIIRVVRLMRVLRVLRVVRVLPRAFKVMVSSIVGSCATLVWIFLLLWIIIYACTLLLMHGITEYFENHLGDDAALDAELVQYYGTVFDAYLTLFAAISGGRDWNEVLEPLWDVGHIYGYLFVFYIYFTVFGALNVITSVFVDSVYKLTLRSREISVQNEKDMNQIHVERIRKFFHEADTSKAGALTLDQLAKSLLNDESAIYFSSLGLDVSQAPELFELLDTDNDNLIGIDEFVVGCMKLKGHARSLDVNMLLIEQRKMMYNWSMFMRYVEQELQGLKATLKVFKSAHGATPQRLCRRVTGDSLTDTFRTASRRSTCPHADIPEA